jgi:hypothetical protein
VKKFNFEKQTALAASVVTLPMASVAWLMAVPTTMTPVTFWATTLVAFGAAYVGFNTWRNSQATEHIGHVLQRTEATVKPGASSALDARISGIRTSVQEPHRAPAGVSADPALRQRDGGRSGC